jgi:hypothetical protein
LTQTTAWSRFIESKREYAGVSALQEFFFLHQKMQPKTCSYIEADTQKVSITEFHLNSISPERITKPDRLKITPPELWTRIHPAITLLRLSPVLQAPGPDPFDPSAPA